MDEEKLEWVLTSQATYTTHFEGFKLMLPSGTFNTRKEAYAHIIKHKASLERQVASPYKSIRCTVSLTGLGVVSRVVYEFCVGGNVYIEEDYLEINGKLRRDRGLPRLATTFRAYPHK